MRVGFLGLGMMGTPMAMNLCRKFRLTVWNRSTSKYAPLTQAGVRIGNSPADVVDQSDVTFVMLFDGPAIDSIFNDDLKRALRGKTLVNTSSVSVEFSKRLAQRVSEAGGDFIEMPVSGSKVPAEQGRLVGMMAGNAEVAERIRPVVEPITSAAVYCGPIGAGLKTKYAANLYLITMTAGLAESMSLAKAQGLDLESFGEVLNAGQMASSYSKLKIAKMLNQDWSPQAAINDCYNSTQLIHAAAKGEDVRAPLIELCGSLYKEAKDSGLGGEDMIAVAKVLSKK
ncbi:hypothetical protein B0T10DRAFT_436326, partial [Thelonectria olida]